jgi:hypothetical protein
MVLKLGTLRKADHNCLESVEMCCWRKLEEIRWTDCLKNEILHRVKEQRDAYNKMEEGLSVFCVGTAFCRMLLNERQRKE